MADQRPAFRFRLPWLTAEPAPRPAIPPRPPAQPTATTTPTLTTPQTAASQPPPQPSSATTPPPATSQIAETQVPSQPSTTITSVPNTQTAERAALTQPIITTAPTPQTPETQNPMQPTAATTTSTPTAEKPPLRPPGVAPAQVPLQSQTSRTESQPSSPSRATTQPPVPSQPASPSRAVTQSQAPSQPSTPPRAAVQPQAVSLPSPPSRRSSQLPSTTQTATQPRSPSSVASTLAGQTSSPPKSSTIAQPPPTAAAVTQPTSPPKTDPRLTEKSSHSSANSTEVVSLLSDKQEPKSAISESPFPELQPKTEITAGVAYDSQDQPPIKTNTQPTEMTQQASKESEMRAAKIFTTAEGPQTPAVTQISDTSTTNGKPQSSPKELKPEETKEVKEVVQDTKDKAWDKARHKDTDLTGDEAQAPQTKDQPSIPLQSEQAQKTIARKQMIATSPSNGKQTKITTAHTRNKTTVADTRQNLSNSNREHIPLHEEIKDNISKLANKMAVGDYKHSIDGRPVSVITLAGENRGASMHVGSHSSGKEGALNIRRGYKRKPDDSAKATTDGEENIKGISNNPKTKDQASEAYVNSNVQVINNSILFNSSITERNPGVHLSHLHFPTESKKPSGKSELVETRKAEFSMTPPQKLTHEPTVRRRCLRGLFLESSDSELDTTKPRRHGCRVGCNVKNKKDNN